MILIGEAGRAGSLSTVISDSGEGGGGEQTDSYRLCEICHTGPFIYY